MLIIFCIFVRKHIFMFKILYNRLNIIINELINKVMGDKNISNRDNVFDLDNIPLYILDDGFQRYHPYTMNISHRNPLSSTIRIDVSTDYYNQILEVKKSITSTFPIFDQQFKIVKEVNRIYVMILVAITDDNVDIIEEAMESQGFFRSHVRDGILLIDKKKRKWLDIRFEVMSSNDVTDEIREKYNIIYHLAPSVIEQQVEKNGLEISNNNPLYKYSETIAFVTEDWMNSDDMQGLANTLYTKMKKVGISNFSSNYTLYKIDISLMSKDIRFFYDINEEKGLYTNVPIPSSAIIGKTQIIAKDKTVNIVHL